MPLGAVGPIVGAIKGGISPTPGLSLGQSIIHGLLSGIPLYRLIGSGVHLGTGTLGQWGDPANNPFTQGGATPEPGILPGNDPSSNSYVNGAPPAPPTNAPADPNDPQYQATADYIRARAAALSRLGGNLSFNAGRPAFSPTSFQQNFPGSAIGPISTGPSDPNMPLPTGIGSPGAPNELAMMLLNNIRARNIV